MTFSLLSRGRMTFKLLPTPLSSTSPYHGCSTEVTEQAMCARVKSWKICFSTAIEGLSLSEWPFPSQSDSFANLWHFKHRVLGQEGGCDDAVQLRSERGTSRDPCSDSFSVWHSASSSVPTPPLALTPRNVSLLHRDSSQAHIYPVVSMSDKFLWTIT